MRLTSKSATRVIQHPVRSPKVSGFRASTSHLMAARVGHSRLIPAGPRGIASVQRLACRISARSARCPSISRMVWCRTAIRRSRLGPSQDRMDSPGQTACASIMRTSHRTLAQSAQNLPLEALRRLPSRVPTMCKPWRQATLALGWTQ